jgi:transcriptional regulator of acetoin/glycerol metabolism
MRERWLEPLERTYLIELLQETSGNVRKAAELAEVNHVTFYRLLKKHGISLGRSVETAGD